MPVALFRIPDELLGPDPLGNVLRSPDDPDRIALHIPHDISPVMDMHHLPVTSYKPEFDFEPALIIAINIFFYLVSYALPVCRMDPPDPVVDLKDRIIVGKAIHLHQPLFIPEYLVFPDIPVPDEVVGRHGR